MFLIVSRYNHLCVIVAAIYVSISACVRDVMVGTCVCTQRSDRPSLAALSSFKIATANSNC